MPAIRLPSSAETLLPFCRRHEPSEDNACFDTYADLVAFTASCGFQRMQGSPPTPPESFLPSVNPIDIAIFKNQGLFTNILLIGLGTEESIEIARDEERLCKLVEAFADIGSKYLSHELKGWTSARFHLEVSNLLRGSTAFTNELLSI